ncbi:hypothetical protein SAMD00019534_078430 [Acytostelium subglobosum LB1]|uniref:hypothetical protein n=1 Tax=Acytostelium subglobosum LB1 TaxID=1410327 RepID=UPI00064501A6|nr:hypothetical protein SAMD00019534_078430 [Acytostelium subglobosum LB1]GAM24668.1 hypothetical protein SAMD00019534_078430 [Acytostelium subglobosum LB1]|eukprot:XP_012752337.1 hypothetical protein SAMD00019534_078430 [Acytostelium subglobosum LB1]
MPVDTEWKGKNDELVPIPLEFKFSLATYAHVLHMVAAMVKKEEDGTIALTSVIDNNQVRVKVENLWAMIHKLIVMLLDHKLEIKDYQWRILCEKPGNQYKSLYTTLFPRPIPTYSSNIVQRVLLA